MSQAKTEAEMALSRVMRQLDSLVDETTRMRNYKGWAAELRPIYEREIARLNASIRQLGGRPRKVVL